MAEPYSRRTLVLLGVLGVLVPGIANYYFHQANLPFFGDLAFAVGYLGAAYLVWHGWVRHLDFAPE